MAFVDHILSRLPDRDVPVTLAGSGDPLLLVHGFPLSRHMWQDVWQGMKDRRLCIAPDLRGFGDASEESDPFSLKDLADDLFRLLDHLQIRSPVTLVGLSMGGYIALEFMAHHGDRVEQVVLMDTRATADTDAARSTRLDMAEKVLELGTEAVIGSMSEKLFSPITSSKSPGLVQQWRERMVRSPASTIALAQRAMASRRDHAQQVASWSVPVLCIVGEQDTLTPVREMQGLAASIPNAQLAIIPESGHLPPIENPKPTIEALRAFLS